MENWKTYKLGEITDLIIDCPHSTPKWTDEGIVVLRSNNIRNGKLNFNKESFTDEIHYSHRIKRAIPQGGDLVITREAPMGEVCMVPDGLKCCLGQRMVLIRPSIKVDNSFLLYVIQGKNVQNQIMIYEGTGSTVSNLRIPVLESLEIPFPPLEEQRSIASILSAIDDKIELNLQMNKTLEEMAMTLYKHWFVDFGPFQEGEFVESELGMIPKGWEVESIGEFGKVVCGKTPSTKDDNNFTSNDGYPFIKIPDMHGKVFVVETTDYISEIGNKLQMKKLLPSGSINVSCIATVGLVTINAFPAHTNQQINSILPEQSFFKYYLYFSMSSLKERFLNEASGGSATLNMNTSTFAGIELLKPNDEVLNRFDLLVSSMFENILQNQNENQTLTTLRDTLLPKLISGEVRVKEAEKILEEVM